MNGRRSPTYLHSLPAGGFSVEVSIPVASELLAVLLQLLVNFYDLLHPTHAVSCPVMVSVFLTQGGLQTETREPALA